MDGWMDDRSCCGVIIVVEERKRKGREVKDGMGGG